MSPVFSTAPVLRFSGMCCPTVSGKSRTSNMMPQRLPATVNTSEFSYQANRTDGVENVFQPAEQLHSASQAPQDNRQPISLDHLGSTLSTESTQPPGDSLLRLQERLATTPAPLDLLHVETIQTLIGEPRVQDALPELMREHAPPGDQSPGSILDLLRSSALRAQAAALSEALRSEQGWEILRSFDIPSSGAPDALTALLAELRRLQHRHE